MDKDSVDEIFSLPTNTGYVLKTAKKDLPILNYDSHFEVSQTQITFYLLIENGAIKLRNLDSIFSIFDFTFSESGDKYVCNFSQDYKIIYDSFLDKYTFKNLNDVVIPFWFFNFKQNKVIEGVEYNFETIEADYSIEKGTASKRIEEVCEKQKITLIMMGKTGADMDEPSSLGSTAENVVLNVNCATLLLTGEDDD